MKVFPNMSDYRVPRRINEYNFRLGDWSLRILFPDFGVCLWRNYEEQWSWNYNREQTKKETPNL